MKSILSILLLFFFITASSQTTRLNGYAMYVFDDKFDSYYSPGDYYNGKFKGGLQWGVGLEYLPTPTNGIELVYLNQQTTADTYYWIPGDSRETHTNFDVGFNWAMLAFNRHMRKPGSKVEGFGGGMLGAAFINVKDPGSTTVPTRPSSEKSATKFAWGLRLGANIWASEKVAIKLQGQLMSAVQGAGGGLYFGTGGAGAGVSTYSSMLQFGLGGGITFALGGSKTTPPPPTTVPQ